MGGPGSGRWYRWQGSKTTVEECRRIDISDWHRRSLLHPGMRFSWNWWNGDGRPVASINVQVQQGRVLLFYRIRQQGGDWQEVEEHVFLTWTPCHYGGQRPWFVCPGGDADNGWPSYTWAEGISCVGPVLILRTRANGKTLPPG
jgi:hypothetical protein